MAEKSREIAAADPAYRHGIDLFNAQCYFDAHENWEELWKQSTGHDRLFFQGLIQCAVALEHRRRGNVTGARSLFRKTYAKFAPLPRIYHGLEIWSFVESVARFLSPAIDAPRTDSALIPPSAWPRITLITPDHH